MNESSKEALLPNMGSAKDKHGIRESFANVISLFAKNGHACIKKNQLKSGAEVQGKLAKAAVPSPEKAPVFAGAREVDELHSFFWK